MNDSSGREETITQAFEALVESIDKLLTFHAEEADLVGRKSLSDAWTVRQAGERRAGDGGADAPP